MSAAGGPRLALVSSHARLGGSEQVLEQIVGHLRGQIVGVVLLEDGPLVERLSAAGVTVTVVPVSGRPAAALTGAARLARALHRVRPDVVHANGVKAALVSVLAPARVPVVWMKHDVSFDGRLGRTLARRCAAVVGVSQEVLRGLGGAGDGCVVPPGVCLDTAASAAAGRALRQELALSAGVVSVVGRLDPAKGHRELLEVLPVLLSRRPATTALLVGADDPHHPGEREALRRRIRELGLEARVRLLDHRPAGGVLAASDAVCVPTVPHPDGAGREGFGLVALEAMALGTPVVAYDVGATREVVGPCAELLPVGDRAQLADALSRLLDDPAAADAARACGLARARELTVERMVERLSAVYGRVSP